MTKIEKNFVWGSEIPGQPGGFGVGDIQELGIFVRGQREIRGEGDPGEQGATEITTVGHGMLLTHTGE